MTRLAVDVPAQVKRQIVEIVSFIADDSVGNALAWEARLTAALDGLADQHGDPIDEDATARYGRPIRKLVFERTYLVHYRVDVDTAVVYVMNVRHGMRLRRAGEP